MNDVIKKLFEEQNGICSLSHLPLTFEENDPNTATLSVDSKQELICSWVAQLRQTLTRCQIIDILIDFQDQMIHQSIVYTDVGHLLSDKLDIDEKMTETNIVLTQILRKIRIGYWNRPYLFYNVDLGFHTLRIKELVKKSKSSKSVAQENKELVYLRVKDELIIVTNVAREVGSFDLFDPDSIDQIFECLFGVLKGGATFVKAGMGYLEELGPE